MPYKKPLKARSGADVQYDSGDYPACQAELLAAAGLGRFPARQAAARAHGRYIGIGLCAWRRRAPGAARSSRASCASSPTGRVTVFTGAAAMGQGLCTALAQICASELGMRAGGVSTSSPGDTGGVSLGLGALRQPADRHGRLFRAARGARGRRQGQEARQPCARGRRAGSGDRRRRGARGRRAAALRSSSARSRACCAARPATASRPASSRGSRRAGNSAPTRWPMRTRCHVAEVEVDMETGEVRIVAIFRAAGFRPADQSDDRGRPGPWRHRARHRQRAVRVDGL